jgi:hypothetical protein
LIEQAIAIADVEERNKAAKYIFKLWGLNPHLRDVLDFHKLWDQLLLCLTLS